VTLNNRRIIETLGPRGTNGDLSVDLRLPPQRQGSRQPHFQLNYGYGTVRYGTVQYERLRYVKSYGTALVKPPLQYHLGDTSLNLRA
jgi:hypothetical protein